MKTVTIVSHPVVDNSMAVLRDKHTKADEFRRHADIVAKFLLIEATKNLKTKSEQVETPVSGYDGQTINQKIVLVPILRAGLSLLSPAYELLPDVSVGFIGLVRDEQTAIADKYYEKLPEIGPNDQVLLVDPMLATGGSMDEALNILEKTGAKNIKAISLLCAPEGLERINKNHPDVEIITASVDEKLNDKAYIVPGLGDFGDRYFGTD